jgi:hypothetical protein
MISPYQISSVLIRKRDSSGNESITTFSVAEWGKLHINSAKTEDFLDLERLNSKSTPGVSQSIWSIFPRAIDVSECVAWGCNEKSP